MPIFQPRITKYFNDRQLLYQKLFENYKLSQITLYSIYTKESSKNPQIIIINDNHLQSIPKCSILLQLTQSAPTSTIKLIIKVEEKSQEIFVEKQQQ
jgi:hypothetical protein